MVAEQMAASSAVQAKNALATEMVKQKHQADANMVAMLEAAASAGKDAAPPAGHAGLVDIKA